MKHGFLLINKPIGPTSHDMVHAMRNVLHERSIGHIGTLDPAASGLLVLAVGKKALKVIEFYSGLQKQYEASITLGKISSTYDQEGSIEDIPQKPGWTLPTIDVIHNVIASRFEGSIEQIPPVYSAIHVNGQRAYHYARSGASLAIPARTITIKECRILSYDYPHLRLAVTCSSGTYIRSLAHDLGQVLRSGGYLSGLNRTKVGEWSLENAQETNQVTWAHVTPLKSILTHLPSLELSEKEAEDIKHGRTIPHPISTDTIAWFDGYPIAILTPKGNDAHPRKVL